MTASSDEEFEDLKEGVKGIVLLFRTIWEEVEHQFSELPKEERYRIFSVIAPVVTDVFTRAEVEDVTGDLTKFEGKRHKKRKR